MTQSAGDLAYSNQGIHVLNDVFISLILEAAYDSPTATWLDTGSPWDFKAKIVADMAAAGMVVQAERGFHINWEHNIQQWMEKARKVLKVRFLLGATPYPHDDGPELREEWEIGSALLLYTYFCRRVFGLQEAGKHLGALDETAYEAVGQLEAKHLIVDDSPDLVTCGWYSCTDKGSEVCQAWLAGRKRKHWPLGNMDLPHRRARTSLRP